MGFFGPLSGTNDEVTVHHCAVRKPEQSERGLDMRMAEPNHHLINAQGGFRLIIMADHAYANADAEVDAHAINVENVFKTSNTR